jgi:hypothetical protein
MKRLYIFQLLTLLVSCSEHKPYIKNLEVSKKDSVTNTVVEYLPSSFTLEDLSKVLDTVTSTQTYSNILEEGYIKYHKYFIKKRQKRQEAISYHTYLVERYMKNEKFSPEIEYFFSKYYRYYYFHRTSLMDLEWTTAIKYTSNNEKDLNKLLKITGLHIDESIVKLAESGCLRNKPYEANEKKFAENICNLIFQGQIKGIDYPYTYLVNSLIKFRQNPKNEYIFQEIDNELDKKVKSQLNKLNNAQLINYLVLLSYESLIIEEKRDYYHKIIEKIMKKNSF